MRAVPTPASTQSTVHCPHVHCPQPAVHCPPTVHFRRRASATAREPEQREGRRATAEGGGQRAKGGGPLEKIGIRQATGGVPRSSRAVLVVQEAATRQKELASSGSKYSGQAGASWGKPDGYLNSRPSRQKTRPTRGKPASRRGGHAADRQRECECKSEAQLGPPDLSRFAPLFSRTRPSQAGLSSIDGVRACRATPTG